MHMYICGRVCVFVFVFVCVLLTAANGQNASGREGIPDLFLNLKLHIKTRISCIAQVKYCIFLVTCVTYPVA